MNQTVDSRKYYPTALVLYITYFVLGIAASIMGQYKQDFAAMWDAAVLTDGSYDVSGVVAVIAAIGLGWLIAFPVAGPLSDRLGRRLSALVGYALYAVFLLAVTFSPNLYVGYALAIVSGMANSFLDTSITPSCMEIFKEKGTIANIFTGLSISIARFLLPFVISFVAEAALPHYLPGHCGADHRGRCLPGVPALPVLCVDCEGQGRPQGADAVHPLRRGAGVPGIHHFHHLYAVAQLQSGVGGPLRPH